MQLNGSNKPIRTLSLTLVSIGLVLCAAAIFLTLMQIYRTLAWTSALDVLHHLLQSSAIAMVLLTSLWVGALLRLARIRRQASWHRCYRNSSQALVRIRGWLIMTLGWAATSLAIVLITETDITIVLVGSLLLFGLPTLVLERTLYEESSNEPGDAKL